jgi:hypothetical protein
MSRSTGRPGEALVPTPIFLTAASGHRVSGVPVLASVLYFAFFFAATSAAWNRTFFVCRNSPRAVLMSVDQAAGATTPCANDPASASDFQSLSAVFRYAPYSLVFASFRAGIEPLTGLNVS